MLLICLSQKFYIPSSLILQKYVPVGDETMAKNGRNNVTVEQSNGKQCITWKFSILFKSEFFLKGERKQLSKT